jgi:hypothetical protein
MNNNVQEQAERFAQLIEQAGVEFNAENVLRCIGFARKAMEQGECSVEVYYKAKRILLDRLECASLWIN